MKFNGLKKINVGLSKLIYGVVVDRYKEIWFNNFNLINYNLVVWMIYNG